MRDLTISEMEMVFGGAGQTGSGSTGSGTNGSVHGSTERDYPSGREVLDGSPSYPRGSAPSNPGFNPVVSAPVSDRTTVQGGYVGDKGDPKGPAVGVKIKLGG